jgi:hypothetical protein
LAKAVVLTAFVVSHEALLELAQVLLMALVIEVLLATYPCLVVQDGLWVQQLPLNSLSYLL